MDEVMYGVAIAASLALVAIAYALMDIAATFERMAPVMP